MSASAKKSAGSPNGQTPQHPEDVVLAAINARLNQTGLLLREMTPDDVAAVMEIEQQAYAAPWSEALYRQTLEYHERAYFDVVIYRQRIIGYSGMWHFTDEIHLGTIATHPAARRMGLGELLLVNVINRAQVLGALVITLEVRPSNLSARALYAKYGFEEVGRRKNYYPDQEDAIIMTTPTITTAAYQALFITLANALLQRMHHFQLEITVN